MRRTGEASRAQSRGPSPKAKWGALAALILLAGAPMASGQTAAFGREKQTQASKPAVEGNKEPRRRIVVSIPHRKLALVEDGRVSKVYPVAVGAPASPSPTGEFKIVHRITHPTYYAPGSPRPVIPPGRDNPLGTRWLGLSQKGFGIHGTNEPRSIGRHASHGCIRMRNRDIEELFERVRAGDAVELHSERDALVAQIFDVPEAPATKPAPASASVGTPVVAASLAGDNGLNGLN